MLELLVPFVTTRESSQGPQFVRAIFEVNDVIYQAACNLCIVLRGSIDEQVKCFGNVVVLGALLPQVSHVFFEARSSQRVLGELTRVDYVVFRYRESVLSLLVLQLVKRLIGLSLHIER